MRKNCTGYSALMGRGEVARRLAEHNPQLAEDYIAETAACKAALGFQTMAERKRMEMQTFIPSRRYPANRHEVALSEYHFDNILNPPIDLLDLKGEIIA